MMFFLEINFARFTIYLSWESVRPASPHVRLKDKIDSSNDHYHNQCIGRGSPVAWAKRSPDLNPLNFYFWGHLKGLSEVSMPDELRERIMNGFTDIKNMPGICQRVRLSFSKHLQACIESDGGHFEHLL